ncbi:DUF6266 family protein [Algoriphagus halophytocola]|uniref:DUF6266 family protein n=1 Tax=Algoriphagus halophytocola TaxID=2991499 RepID=A0ABY6MLE8_9BACT|nr:DUF6266 family protein [Algoriphagus sp. TR-M5]UZD24364.1 DUF6266 family protein [Algoriphagus sp. TR-M5]
MARVSNSSLEGLNGNMGDMVYYKINGVTYTRRKPRKRSNAEKKKMKTSSINERSQGMFTMVQQYLKGLSLPLRFGFQGEVKGARHGYHACSSYTRLNCFALDGQAYRIDPALFKVSIGTLMGAEDAEAIRTDEGVLFTWRDNSGTSSAKEGDQAFLVIHNPTKEAAVWKEVGNYRKNGQDLLNHTFGNPEGEWHAYLAFSQENQRSKKRKLSNSIYLGMV